MSALFFVVPVSDAQAYKNCKNWGQKLGSEWTFPVSMREELRVDSDSAFTLLLLGYADTWEREVRLASARVGGPAHNRTGLRLTPNGYADLP